MGEAARKAEVYLAVGVIERDTQFGGGTLHCTLLYFGPDGQLLGKYRKLKPTAAERLIWGEGDGSTLTTIDTEYGAIGGLICWENYMPLARMAMYSKGVELYLAPTADARDSWQATLRHIACEGRCFVLGCNQFVTRSMYPADLEGIEDLANQPEIMCRGGSAIISPLGDVLAGPLYDAVVRCAWSVELHDKASLVHWEEFGPGHMHYIPLSSMIPRNADNIVAAGRCIDADPYALSSVRVMGPCIGMGAAAAHSLDMAGSDPVYQIDLAELQQRLYDNLERTD